MTCERIEKCANGEYCNYHVGFQLPSCMNFKQKQEQTNEEWLRSASTEELAEWVSDIVYECSDKMVQEDGYGCAVCNLHWCSKQDVLEWLKEVQ